MFCLQRTKAAHALSSDQDFNNMCSSDWKMYFILTTANFPEKDENVSDATNANHPEHDWTFLTFYVISTYSMQFNI